MENKNKNSSPSELSMEMANLKVDLEALNVGLIT